MTILHLRTQAHGELKLKSYLIENKNLLRVVTRYRKCLLDGKSTVKITASYFWLSYLPIVLFGMI
jgi:hypothetical protein